MKSFANAQKRTVWLSEEEKINLSRLNKLILSCKKCRDAGRQEELIYETIPLFNELFHLSTFQDIFQNFPDVHIFCSFVSGLFVKEIRTRAIDQTSEEGSKLIAAFLEDGLSGVVEVLEHNKNPKFVNFSPGNLLLLTLEKLSCSASLLESMSTAGVSSTLVKCLYIFLDLPPVASPDGQRNRMLLQRKFTELLQHVCLSSVAVEEMVHADALRHLFSAAVDPCQSSNAFWRKSSCTILTTLAQNCLSPPVIQYIHDAGCIVDYVERLKQIQLPKVDSLEAFVSLFQVLSESAATTPQLLDDFHFAGGYSVIADYLLKYELEEGDEEALAFCQRLTRLLGDLVYVGPKELQFKSSAIVEVFQLPGFRLKSPRAKGEALRNMRAVDSLQATLLAARSTGLCVALLEQVRELYKRAPGNYFLLDKHHLISSIAEVIASKPDRVQEVFFDVFAMLIERLCYVPLQEISSVALLLRKCRSPSCLQHAFSCLLRLILTFPTLKEFYRNVGILEVSTQHLQRCVDTIFRPPDVPGNSTPSSSTPMAMVHKPSVYEAIDQLGDAATLTELLCTILRLLVASVAQSVADISIVSGAKGIHYVLARLLPQPALPPAVVRHALNLLYEVLVAAPSEDQLLGLLDLLPSADTNLRIEILRLLCNVLRDSHRCRTIFRKCNGSVRIIHQLVMLNGCLATPPPCGECEEGPPSGEAAPARRRQALLLIRGVLAVLTVAMKFEPASAKHFIAELQFESLEQAIRLLGCFNNETVVFPVPADPGKPPESSSPPPQDDSPVTSNIHSDAGVDDVASRCTLDPSQVAVFRAAFLQPVLLERGEDLEEFRDVPRALLDVCLIFRYLVAMALDEFDRNAMDGDPTLSLGADVKAQGGQVFAKPPSIVHTGAVLVILRLIPAIIRIDGFQSATLNLQHFALELILALLESERSQQLLCGGGGGITDTGMSGMPRALLVHFRPALAAFNHPLHASALQIFSLLAAHSLTPRDFRDFLRLSGQFCDHEQSPTGNCLPTRLRSPTAPPASTTSSTSTTLGRIEDVPLLTLPALPAITELLEQTVHRQRNAACRLAAGAATGKTCLPAFVEFDMSVEGFGCLFLPSLAPQRIAVEGTGGSSTMCVGGVGVGERAFPPVNGITFCSWVCVNDFGIPGSPSSSQSPPHPIRLLTVFKGIQGTNEQLICLSVHIDPLSRALIVSTKERILPSDGSANQQRLKSGSLSSAASVESQSGGADDPHTAVFATATTPGVEVGWPTDAWRHLAVVLARSSVVRSSSSLCSLYLDGSLVGTQKISFGGGGGVGSCSGGGVATSVCAFVGSPPSQWAPPCPLRWRQGPLLLLEEPLTPGQVALIAALGPDYVGSLQAPPAPPDGEDILQPLFAEEKLSFAACGSTSVTLTITRIRRVYNPTDAALICKVLHMPLRENLTPIRVLRNLATQLSGAARSLGAVLVGYQGVRVFAPRPLGALLGSLADPAGLLLSLLALSNTSGQLKGSLRAVFCVIGASHATAAVVQKVHGYQLMAGILRKKNQLIDKDIIDLITQFTFNQVLPPAKFEGVAMAKDRKFSMNQDAFRDLLCDLELWLLRPVPGETDAGDGTDYSLVAHLVDRLVSRLAWICDEQTSSEAKALSEKLAKLLSTCLFDNVLFLLVDALESATNDNARSSHVLELVAACMRLFAIVLLTNPTYGVLQLLNQFLIWTLPRGSQDEDGEDIPDETENEVAQERSVLIYARNQCFLLLAHLLSLPQSKCLKLCDQLVTTLGFDWFLLFLTPSVHDATAAHALRAFSLALLTFAGTHGDPKFLAGYRHLLQAQQAAIGGPESSGFPGLVAFRKEAFSGAWMRATAKSSEITGAGAPSGAPLPFASNWLAASLAAEVTRARLEVGGGGGGEAAGGRVGGFLALSALLVNNARMPEIYAMLIHLLLGVRTPFIPASMATFDDLYNHLVHVITTETNPPGLSDSAVPPIDFFLTRGDLGLPGVTDFSAVPTTSPTPPDSDAEQTMHNSNLFDTVACPEAATIIISILSSLMRLPLFPRTPAAQHLPVVMLQLFSYLYQSNFYFQTVCLSPEFLTGLIDLLVISSVSQVGPDAGKPAASADSADKPASPKTDQQADVVCDFSWRRLDELLLSFLRTIVVDSFSLPPNAHRPVHVIDTVLEAEHSSCSTKQQHELQTVLVRNLMEYMLAKDLMMDSCFLLPSRGYAQHIPQNVAYFVCRVVDKLWQGCFLGSISEIIDFITQLIQILEEHLSSSLRSANTASPRHYPCVGSSVSPLHSAGGATGCLDPSVHLSRASLYRSLNRCVLFQLSRPVLKQRDQKSVISMLQLLLTEDGALNSLVFSAFNSADTEFPVCLANLLIQHVQRCSHQAPETTQGGLGGSGQGGGGGGKEIASEMRLYRTVFDTEEFEDSDDDEGGKLSPRGGEDLPAQQEEFEQLAALALKLWEHCYMWNQKVFVALLPDSSLSHLPGVPNLLEWSALLEGPCIMRWTAYVDAEATGCGGIVSQNASTTAGASSTASSTITTPTAAVAAGGGGGMSSASSPSCGSSQWGLLSMYGPSTIERQLESTNNKVSGAAATSEDQNRTPTRGLSHQISKKLGRMGASVLRMASNAASVGGSVGDTGSSSASVSRRRPGAGRRQFSLIVPSDIPSFNNSGGGKGASSGTDDDWILVPRVPVGLPLLTKKSTALSTLKRISSQVKSPLALIVDSLRWSKQSQERDATFLRRQVEIEWNKMEDNLTQERSIWGPMCADDESVKWELDPTEGPCRMRKRMLPNPGFYRHYPTICRSSVGGNGVDSSSANKDNAGSRSPDSALVKRCCMAPHSLGVRFRHRKRRLLRGSAEPSSRSRHEEVDPPAVEEALGGEAMEEPADPGALGFTDISESEDTLIRTSRLLRDRSARSSFPEEGYCDATEVLIPEEIEEDEEEEDLEPKPSDSSSGSDSIDLGAEGAAPLSPRTTAPLPPPTPTQSAPLSTPAAISTSKAKPSLSTSSTALDQLTGHIAFMRLLEPGESLSSIYRCARICGLDVHEGLLLFGKEHFYVIDGYTLMNTHEIVSIEALPPGMQHKPIVPTGGGCESTTTTAVAGRRRQASVVAAASSYASDLVSSGAVEQISGNQYFKFAYDKIREVHRRRYLLQQIALEVFNADGRNFFLVFARDFQNKVYECFTSATSAINQNKFTSLYSARTNSHLLSSLLGEKTVTQRWVRGEISNFQYLMYLNTQAGRSYNDLMQYPVFPWVLADYTSERLDLTRATTFRDLTRPMGAQTPARLAQFQRRFRDWEDPSGDTPPYHYGTHYSSAMIVASYLVRMEPFTQHFIKLQGGHFDLPDRMFHSVEEAWLSASQHNMADVRELIPEFFYLPDFLINSNRFDFGCRQSGARVDHVALPPWAKGDPREFIRLHREALESDYVSANLHHWIDLIFGYKQRGEAAVAAANVFHHLFYEGNVDIYAIDDPVRRRAVVGFINNFGQIPRQIFRKPHPAKKVILSGGASGGGNGGGAPDSRSSQPSSPAAASNAASQLFFHNLGSLKLSVGALRELRHAVGQILQLEPGSLKGISLSSAGSSGASLSSSGFGGGGAQLAGGGGGFSTLVLPASGLFALGGAAGGGSSGVGVGGGGGGSSSGDSSSSSGAAAGPIVVVEQNMVLLPPNYTRYLSWGYPDDSFRVCSLVGDRILQVFEAVNSSQVLCAAAPNATTVVTAGMSGVVSVWQLRSPSDEQGRPFYPSEWIYPAASAPSAGEGVHSAGVVFGTTTSSLRLAGSLHGHTDVVTCLAASDSFNLIVSGGRDCTCIVWDLRYLIFLRQLCGGGGGAASGGAYRAPVAAVCISEATGDIAVCAGTWLYLWSITGELIACLNTAPDQSNQIYCVAMSTLRDWDAAHVIITGGSDGYVRMWGLDYVCEESPDSTTSKFPSTSITCSGEQATVRWRRQLSLRAALTVHTAFERTPASSGDAVAPGGCGAVPLMALAVSRDHRALLVGDAKGRLFAWSVPTHQGQQAAGVSAASPAGSGAVIGGGGAFDATGEELCASAACGVRFSRVEKKHHCRNCGKAFCSKCSRFESEIHPLRIFRPVRVCTDCYALLREQQGPTGP